MIQIFLFLGFLVSPLFASQPKEVVIQAPAGSVAGVEENGLHIFRGIPFAEPPVGLLRFQPPQAKSRWTDVKEAKTFALACPQYPVPGMEVKSEENCLFLNIWTPKTKGPHPVMVWIHGGGNMNGASFQKIYDGSAFARDGVVFVSIAYRLGAFGFLELGQALGSNYRESGNNGLRDQILALQWVQQNVASFGGNPQQVTIAGESAGAQDTASLLVSPLAKGLFQRAIIDSPSNLNLTFPQHEAVARAFLQTPQIPQGNPSAVLTLPLQNLIFAQLNLLVNYRGFTPFQPLVGGEVLPRSPIAAFKRGDSHEIPLLIATVRDEAELFLRPTDNEETFANHPLATRSIHDVIEMAPIYRSTFPQLTPHQQLSRALTAGAFWIPAIRLAEYHSQNQGHVWMYRFDRAAKQGSYEGLVPHSADLPFIFDNFNDEEFHEVYPESNDLRLAQRIHAIWVSFIKTGQPHFEGIKHWPLYESTQRSTLLIDHKSNLVLDPLHEERLLWQERILGEP